LDGLQPSNHTLKNQASHATASSQGKAFPNGILYESTTGVKYKN
jgi:hypothetical protein